MPKLIDKSKAVLSRLPFRTGVIILCLCAVFYAVSFAQMLLPISAEAKGVLWFVFFGLAKTAQYSAIAILGAAGIARIKGRFRCTGRK
ncbi:MAG: hypothetical protein NC115_05410 [Bacteroidales bacterium]|nr:hypothetical protein [Bacteroides sp.]MCM1502088.1 hypothetical protein [Bacteroidales bacterium]